MLQFLNDWQGVIQWFVSSGTFTAADALRLHDDLWLLKTTLPRAAVAVDEAEWWRFVDPRVSELLTRLKDAAYDAEDVLDDRYQEAQLRTEGRFGQAGQLLSSSLGFFKSWGLEHAASEVNAAMDGLRSMPGALGQWRRPTTSAFLPHMYEGTCGQRRGAETADRALCSA